MEYIIASVVIMLVGLFCIVCSIKEYNWFFNNRKARLVVEMFGKKAAKIFYIFIGAFLLVLGFIALLNL